MAMTTQPAIEAPDDRGRQTETRPWLRERVSSELALFVGLSWYVLFWIGTSLEPRAAHPDAFPSWLQVGVSGVFWGLVAVMVAGLVSRRRWGLVASLGAAALFTSLSIACPASGHHSFGAWWFAQMGCAVGLVGISVAALRRA
jgi:hypothetical protein